MVTPTEFRGEAKSFFCGQKYILLILHLLTLNLTNALAFVHLAETIKGFSSQVDLVEIKLYRRFKRAHAWTTPSLGFFYHSDR